MKKIVTLIMSILLLGTMAFSLSACSTEDTIYVDTNAYFAPFEYYDGNEIKGVDVDIMELVGKKLNKKIVIQNTDFGVIIDNVASGKQYDCGAAGITITDERKALVDFSNPYFTSVQYVIFKNTEMTKDGTADGVDYIKWDSLAGKKIGVQRDTTGDIYVDGEINAQESDPDYGYNGVLYGKNSELLKFDDAQLAVAALGTSVDVVVVDKLPAEYLVNKNSGLSCYALYYYDEETKEATPTEEQYAICVTKGNTELLNAINEVLAELGEEGINDLVSKHLGLN